MIKMTCGFNVVEVMVCLRKFKVASNSSSNSLLFFSCSKNLTFFAVGSSKLVVLYKVL